MVLNVEVTNRDTRLSLEWLDKTVNAPASLLSTELVFFVQLARIGIRERIIPREIKSPVIPEPHGEYADYFGVKVTKGKLPAIVFKAEDAKKPFLTANQKMWEFFEPELQKRLSELDQGASVGERTKAALLEMLPGGNASMESVARRLGTSTRTLQRKLKQEGVSFQAVLNQTREHLARHYLKSTTISGAEISYLLGFEDPNSFFRAFHGWTGTTPEQARLAMQGAH
jgi:AraC-like DNA-binding protein